MNEAARDAAELGAVWRAKMKRVLALALALCLIFSAAALGQNGLNALGRTGLMADELLTSDNRLTTVTLILMDYAACQGLSPLELPAGISREGVCYVGTFGRNTIDLYVPASGGGYINLFAALLNGSIEDLGACPEVISCGVNYEAADMQSVIALMPALYEKYY